MNEFYMKNKNMDQGEFREMDIREKILNYSAGFEVPPGQPEEQSLKKLMEGIHGKPRKKAVILRGWLRIAAMLPLALLIYAGFSYFSMTKVKTEYAEQKFVILPDQSEIILNAGSKVIFNKRTFNKNRTMKLTGEAFLRVQKGSGFSIYTPSGLIEILGTELNILSRDSIFKVTCVTGKVKVTSHNQVIIAEPGEKARLIGEKLVKEGNLSTEKEISWKNGEFYFEDTPLLYIFDEIERQFNVSVEAGNLENRYFTGSFSNKNLRETLNIVCIPMELKYEIRKGNKVVILSETD